MDITAKIAEELGIRKNQAHAAIQLIDEGNTIPFIARYRKEATGALNDEILRNLFDRLTYLRNLEEKKEQVIASIEEQGKLLLLKSWKKPKGSISVKISVFIHKPPNLWMNFGKLSTISRHISLPTPHSNITIPFVDR